MNSSSASAAVNDTSNATSNEERTLLQGDLCFQQGPTPGILQRRCKVLVNGDPLFFVGIARKVGLATELVAFARSCCSFFCRSTIPVVCVFAATTCTTGQFPHFERVAHVAGNPRFGAVQDALTARVRVRKIPSDGVDPENVEARTGLVQDANGACQRIAVPPFLPRSAAGTDTFAGCHC